MPFAKTLITCFTSLIIGFGLHAQQIVIDTTYLKGTNALANDMIETNDGGYAITGSVTPPGYYGDMVLLLKLNSNFKTEWVKTYGIDEQHGNWRNTGANIFQRSNGEFVIAGIHQDGTLSMPLFVVIDSNGKEKQFIKSPTNSTNEYFSEIKKLNDGGYLASMVRDNDSTYVVKFDSLFNIKWTLGTEFKNGKIQALNNHWFLYETEYHLRDHEKLFEFHKFKNNNYTLKRKVQIDSVSYIGGAVPSLNEENLIMAINRYYSPPLDTLRIIPTQSALVKVNEFGRIESRKRIYKKNASVHFRDFFKIDKGYGGLFSVYGEGLSLKLINKNLKVTNTIELPSFDDLKFGIRNKSNHILYDNDNGINIIVIKNLAKKLGVNPEPDKNTNDLKIIPNPVQNTFQLKGTYFQNGKHVLVKLFNVHGELVLSKKLFNTVESLNVAHLSKGAYYLKIFDRSKSVKTLKLIKL